jgi:hypothetical protein
MQIRTLMRFNAYSMAYAVREILPISGVGDYCSCGEIDGSSCDVGMESEEGSGLSVEDEVEGIYLFVDRRGVGRG